jgi:uncharacterized protein YodC (DUF2158 family)
MPEGKEGDVVQCKSGGPQMTIIALDYASGEAICRWFEGRKPTEDIVDVVALACITTQTSTRERFRLRP